MRQIQSFVIRVYRRDTRGIWGVVEDVQTGCFHTFHSASDLWAVLDSRAGETTPERKPQ